MTSAERPVGGLRRALAIVPGSVRRRVHFFRATWELRGRVPPLVAPEDPSLVVSLTSFPSRIRTVWATIATLLRQTHRPDVIVLVLAEEEFPDRRLPRMLRRMQQHGLEILWTPDETRGLKKLLPTRARFPDATIITADDDHHFEPEMVERLLAASQEHPGTIVGHRGWIVHFGPDGPLPYFAWVTAGKAGPDVPSDRVFLTGGAGALYPPLPELDRRLLDVSAAMRVTPTADDVWFWAASIAADVGRHCTGEVLARPNGLEGLSPSLFDVNKHDNDEQIAAAISHFSLDTWFRARGTVEPPYPAVDECERAPEPETRRPRPR